MSDGLAIQAPKETGGFRFNVLSSDNALAYGVPGVVASGAVYGQSSVAFEGLMAELSVFYFLAMKALRWYLIAGFVLFCG